MRLRPRPTVRGRLAVLLAALVVATGLVLLPVTYLLVRASVVSTLAQVLAAASRRAAVRPPPQPGAGGAHQQVVTHSESVVAGVLSTLLGQYGLVLAALVVVAGGVAWLAAGRMLRPLRQITGTARRITGEDLHERLALRGPADELTELGGTFDAMLDRLEAAFTAQQLFAANAAHELRTPLAVMRAELDLLLTGPAPPPEVREAAARLRRTVLGSQRLLERLLTLTRGMLAPGEAEPVPLHLVAGQALAAAAQAASQRGLSIRAELGEAGAYGDSSLLGELAGNLIGNAVAHNRPGGWVAVGTHTDGGHAVLEVSNSGPPVAEADLGQLLEPFRRAGPQRTGGGSGLGLSIVAAVANAHRGALTLRALPGGGLTVRVTLPAAPAGTGGQETASDGR